MEKGIGEHKEEVARGQNAQGLAGLGKVKNTGNSLGGSEQEWHDRSQ